MYRFDAGRVEEALAARARAVELVPAQPPTGLRARVTAAMAQALVNARRRDEARRWCDEVLVAARGADSAGDQADVLSTLGMIEQYDDRPAPIRPWTGTSPSGRPSWPAGRATWSEHGRPSGAALPPPTRWSTSTRRWRVPGWP
jgi:hypothetical protein